jgi:hypothetical protein
MSQSIEEYRQRWKAANGATRILNPAEMVEITPQSVIMNEVISDSIGSGSITDFGDAICCRQSTDAPATSR